MRPWEPHLQTPDAGGLPLFVQLARTVSQDIQRGRLKAGDRLPGSRALAAQLGVHRNTVLAAYAELVAEGWIRTARASGTFVSEAFPEPRARPFTTPQATLPNGALGFALPARPLLPTPPPPPKGALVLAGGAPDLTMVPRAELARAYRRALANKRGAALLDYADPCGHPALRRALADMVRSVRAVTAEPDNVLVTRGSQMALDLVARALLSPGDTVLVEAWGYQPAWSALRMAGARLVAIPVDNNGLDVEAAARVVERGGVKAIYVTPHHQYPTTVVLSAARRMALLDLARRHKVAIIEDDYDHEFHYEGHPVTPLASADRHGVVVYLGTLSKILAPGLRTGFVVAPQALVKHLGEIRRLVDRQGDHAVEAALAQLLEDGSVQRHARRMRRVYHRRRDALVEALHATFGSTLQFTVPPGGMALWVAAPGRNVDAWAQRARNNGTVFTTASQYAFDGSAQPFMRLGFAGLTEKQLQQAVAGMRC